MSVIRKRSDPEYYLGQAIALYGLDSVQRSINERKKVFNEPFDFLDNIKMSRPADSGVGPPKPE